MATFPTSDLAILALAMLLVATVMAGTLSSRFGLPALLGFLALGMFAGSEGPIGIEFANYGAAQFIGVICLIFILFSGGIDTKWSLVRPMAWPALLLATVGVAVSAGVVALASMLLLGFSPLQGFLLGAVVASTDAAAVFAVLRGSGQGIRSDLTALIELESGSNDPMAIFLVGAALMLIITPTLSPASLMPAFIWQMAAGALVGFVIGWALPELLRRSELRFGGLALVVSIAAALLAYGLAANLGGNGFLAAYVAGLVAGNRRHPQKKNISQFQDGVAWLAQVVMFLALGLLVFPAELIAVAGPGLAVTVILMFLARPLSVFISLAPFRQFDWRAKAFVSWAGLRGAVPIVLATFPIVAGVPGARTIFNIVFFVVLISSMIQGPSLRYVARKLGVATREIRDGPQDQPDGDVRLEGHS